MWFEQQIGNGRASQPSSTSFPLAATQVSDLDAPPAVRDARDHYRAACSDWGGAWIHRQAISSHEVFYVHVGTDGDDGALEIFDTAGNLLDAAFVDGQTITWEDRSAIRLRFDR
jgi:hypothetical protein